MKTLSCFFVLFIALVISKDAFARKLKPYRINIMHYYNTHSKGILYEVTEEGIALVKAVDVLHIPKEMIVKGIKEGRILISSKRRSMRLWSTGSFNSSTYCGFVRRNYWQYCWSLS